MRDLLVFIFFLGSIPVSLLNPVNGVILYALVSYLNPHRLTWGYAVSLPMAKAIALATILGFFFYRGDKKFPMTREMMLLTIFWMLAFLGWPFALNPTGYVEEIVRFSKILLMVYVTVSLIKTKKDLRWLMLVITLSIGFYSLKGAIWGLRGGVGWVRGPTGTFFDENNEMGMVINMVWPLFLFMSYSEKNKWLKRLLLCFFWVSPLTVILTKSRGAALAMTVTAFILVMRAKNRFAIFFIGGIICFASIPFIPAEWAARMGTIQTYSEDASAMGRINAWYAAVNIAVDRPLTGGGLRTFTPEMIYRYAPEPNNYHDVHSIYFEVLGELGFPGIIVFLSLIAAVVLTLRKVHKFSRMVPDGEFFANYSNAVFLGLVAYLANGLTLGLAYFDLFYQYVGIAVSLQLIFIKEYERIESEKVKTV